MATKPINVVIKGDYTDRDINRAIADLERLRTQSGTTGGALGVFQKGMVAAGGALAAAFSFDAVISAMKDAAQAAMEDEKSMVALATAMDNVGLSSKNAEAEGLIESMMLQTGIADDRLRPAFQKLVTVTNDVGEAQRLLKLSTDLAAAGYGDLTSTSKALSAAANGNFTALQRLRVPIDAGIIAAKDFEGAINALNNVVGGQAAAAADTYAGQMAQLSVAAGEAQEAIGYALLRAMDDMIGKMGGTGGLQQSIIEAGDSIASMIDQIALAGRAVDDLGRQLVNLSTGGLVKVDDSTSLVAEGLQLIFDQILDILMGPLPPFVQFLKDMGWYSDNAAGSTSDLALEQEHMARASGKAAKGLAGLTDDTEAAGDAAWYASKSYLALWESIYQADRAQSDFANTSGTVSSAIAAGARTGGVAEYWENLRQKYGEVEKAARGAGSGVSSASKSLSKFQQDAGTLAQSLGDLANEVGLVTADAGKATFDKINSQVEQFKATFAEAKSFAQGIVSTFMAELDLGAALDQAKAAGTSIVEEFANQGKKAEAFGKRMNEMLAAGLSKTALQDILKLGFDRGMDVMNALADGNVQANVENVNKVYRSVESLATSVADQARSVFYDSGMQSMVTTLKGMIDELMPEGKTRKRLMAMMDNLAASLNRTSTITVATVYSGGPPPSLSPVPGDLAAAMAGYSGPVFTSPVDFSSFGAGVQMFADGGIATSPTLGIFGEAGPEALIPLDRMGSVSGGNTYQITVQTGVGDPRQIGEQVVSYIKRFEAASGPVFARA